MPALDPWLPQPDLRTPSPGCGKARYPDKKSAVTAGNARTRGRQYRRRNRPESLRAYPCPRCGGWHLTHQTE